MRKIITVLTAFLVLCLVLALAPMASASNHFYATDKIPPGFVGGAEHRISLIANCDAATTYPANTGFFTSHGWFNFPWKDISPAEKNWFMSSAQTFELRIDGVLQKSNLHAFMVSFPDDPRIQAMFKNFVTENDRGLAGTHTFVGTWYFSAGYIGGNPLDRVFDSTCTTVVTFV